ncbi:MAG: hypothetical protein M3Y03_06515, partial [Verrucomicrobiota bacterium]|nr:hypothetical protein [Verrucomicrobiota bacterium]
FLVFKFICFSPFDSLIFLDRITGFFWIEFGRIHGFQILYLPSLLPPFLIYSLCDFPLAKGTLLQSATSESGLNFEARKTRNKNS